MIKTLEAQLYLTTAIVLEELGYLLPIPSEELDGKQAALALSESVCVEFEGARSGSLYFRISGMALTELSANMLGREDNPGPELRRDALGEFASVLCGNLLPAVYGCGPAFDIRSPSFPVGAEIDSYSGGLACRVELGLESGGRAEALLFLTDNSAIA